MKKRITIDGGAVVYVLEHPVRQRGDSENARAQKKKTTSDAQAARNRILSTRELELTLARNFPTAGSGLVTVLTFDDEHLPKTRAQALRRLKYFLTLLRKARSEAGLPPPRVVHAPEVLTSESGRWHLHTVIDSTGQDMEMIRRCWIYGGDVDITPLRVDDEKNHETLARYMNKELREAQDYQSRPGLHGWSCTRNCLRPEVDEQIVEDRKQLRAPKGSTVLMQERRSTEFAESYILKYRLSPDALRGKPKARRRRPC